MRAHLPRRRAERRGLRLWPVGAVLVLAFATAIIVAATVFYTGWDLLGARGLKPEHRIDSTTLFDLVKLSFGVVAGAGALVALVVAYRRQRVDEDGALREATRLHTERFTTAVSQLGDESAAVCLGGVHALAGLADDAPTRDLRQTCIDVLCAYLQLPFTPDPGTDPAHQEEHHRYLAFRKVRHTILRLIGDHYRRPWGTHRSWQGCDLDLTGVTIDSDMDFQGAKFSGGSVSFRDATFSSNKWNFRDATFSSGSVSFYGAKFSGSDMEFQGAKFSGGSVSFRDATFSSGSVSFFRGKFSGSDMDFQGATFSGGSVSFRDATFRRGEVSFGGATFSGGSVSFGDATFSGSNVTFNDATFSGGEVSFGASFSSGHVTLVNARFSGADVSLINATFSGGDVFFNHATFSGGEVFFINATFSAGSVSFGDATFSGGEVSFVNATFSGGEVSFSGATGEAPSGLVPSGSPPVGLILPPAWSS
ncbi:pentapeptide repeat-containing protein [Streptomyces sp. NPDC050564]|uniref:pentapeptide repeat-containing protein n=1 Tax=Streptomyces sp. NPDC050564 TaxID=3365631 RepID=UPI0037B4C3F8